ncbi:MAG: hypothetical protein HY860_00605 [Chlamydiales bacterium]|nr:hypothetical protein [Chlamydiales bacterium]
MVDVKKRLLKEIFKIKNNTLYLRLAGFKDSEGYYYLAMSRMISHFVLDDKGKILFSDAVKWASLFPSQLCHEKEYLTSYLNFFKAIENSKQMQAFFSRIRMPIASKWVEKVIQMSLFEFDTIITDLHLKRAVLSGLLCCIRQNIGSCFATATAIFVQNNQIELLLKDLLDLISMGQLKRSGEQEIRMPMGIAISRGDLGKYIGNIEKLSFHVGWIEALRQIQLIDQQSSMEESVKSFRTIIDQINPIGQTFEQLIEKVLYLKHRITKEEFLSRKNQKMGYEVVASKKKNILIDYEKDNTTIENILLNFSQHALLKGWEYTIASFVDYESKITTSNLIVALGLNQSEEFGVGKIVYEHLQLQLDQSNTKIQELTNELILLQDRLKMSERLMATVDSEEKYRRLRNEMDLNLHRFYTYEKDREELIEDTKNYSEFFSFLIGQLQFFFPLYFQEIYDPNLHDRESVFYEDSAAGFRLVFKHGRAEPSVWTIISSEEEYVKCLKEFFYSIENLIRNNCEWEKGKEEIRRVVDITIALIEKKEFLHHGLDRTIQFQKKYAISRKIINLWSYLAGGTIHSLLKGYFAIRHKLSDITYFPKDPMELCIALIDFMKECPLKLCEEVQKNPKKCFLMYSPTHVFLFHPGNSSFFPVWDNSAFTYTWLRDHYMQTTKEFYSKILLSGREQQYLYDSFYRQYRYPEEEAKLTSDAVDIFSFAKENLPFSQADVAQCYYEQLPLIDKADCLAILKELNVSMEISQEIISTKELLFLLTVHSELEEEKLVSYFIKHKLLPLSPLIFADSNWEETKFAFVLNPLTLELDFWRVSTNGLYGRSMAEWKGDFGIKKPPNWGVFQQPQECYYYLEEIKMHR